jgi:general secretion pathway protein G
MQDTIARLRRRQSILKDREGGFTLIELLIVIVILGILAAIVVFAVQNLTSSSAKASCGSDFKTVETAVEGYKAQMGNYPNNNAANGAITDTDTGLNAAAVANVTGAVTTGGELLSGSLVTPAVTSGTLAPAKDANGNATSNVAAGSAVGPWLKDVPSNGTHYTITVSNDGHGTILVNSATVNGAASCSAAGVS